MPGLVDDFDTWTNVAWPLLRVGTPRSEVDTRVRELMGELGLSGAEHHPPRELSGGMQRRAALARALIRRPSVLLLDDPTAGLDPVTTTEVMDLLLDASHRRGAAVLVTTHDLQNVVTRAARVLGIRGGDLVDAGGDVTAWAGSVAA